MPLRFSFALSAAALLLPLTGCNQDQAPVDTEVTMGKQFSIDPVKRRSSTLLDRMDDETGQSNGGKQTDSSNASKSYDVASSRGSGLFAFGSSGVDDLQVAAKSEAPLDLRLLETETVDSAYKAKFDRGEEMLRTGRLDQALLYFDEAKTINTRFYQAYVGEAFAYFRKGNYGRAAAAIDQAIRVAPQVVVLYNHRAHISAQLGDFRKAIADLDHVLKLQPDDISSLVSRSQCHIQIGNQAAAVNDFTTALKLRPNDQGLLMQRSIAYYKLGKYKECAADATAVINQRRDAIDPFFIRAAARANLDDLEGGKSDYDEAVKLGLSPAVAAQWRPRFYPNNPRGAGS